MRTASLIWTWILCIIILIVCGLFLWVGIFSFYNAAELAPKLVPPTTPDVVVGIAKGIIIASSIPAGISLTLTIVTTVVMRHCKTKMTIITLGVLNIVFNGIVPGILILLVPKRELKKQN